MLDTQAKYHHLIPQTYMDAWAHGNGTLYVKFNGKEEIQERNKENIAGINHYHSISAGMVICTQSDADLIFSPLESYTVKYDGSIITDTLELNKLYYDFDKWEIERADGTPVSKKKLRAEIEQIKIRDIEVLWSEQYENKWSDVRAQIENAVMGAKTEWIPAFETDFLVKFYTALDWRSLKSNLNFDDAVNWLCKEILQFDEVDIPTKERFLPMLENAADEIRHSLLLKFYRQYLNGSGVIYENALANAKHSSFHFLVADGAETFYTSDNPAFVHKREDGFLVGILPISPRILMCQCKKTDCDNYYGVTHITEEAVKRYNRAICEHSNRFIILEKK